MTGAPKVCFFYCFMTFPPAFLHLHNWFVESNIRTACTHWWPIPPGGFIPCSNNGITKV